MKRKARYMQRKQYIKIAHGMDADGGDFTPLRGDRGGMPGHCGEISRKMKSISIDIKSISTAMKSVPADMKSISAEMKPVPADMNSIAAEMNAISAEMKPVPADMKSICIDMNLISTDMKWFFRVFFSFIHLATGNADVLII
ncbi:MAG: hypothetical protein LBK07_03095 [Tannerella sp.]|nr:hypothetical protein [Tannerella sp.]